MLLFSLYSNRTELAKAIILPLAAEMFKGCYKNGKLWEYCECDGSNIGIELLRDALTLLPNEHLKGTKTRSSQRVDGEGTAAPAPHPLTASV